MPDADGTVGRAIVSNPNGKVELSSARDVTVVTAEGGPGRVRTMSRDDAQEIFGAALAALPPPPRHFTLFFRFDSEELTDESTVLLRDVLRLVQDHPASDVIVLGHTDTTGAAARNFDLGLRRANKVRALLVASGLRRSRIDVTSFGEREPLVKTGDGVFEPRNRRVEVTVR
jgi:outer membrane protein OmpA-like peptidoglycan-associated protein